MPELDAFSISATGANITTSAVSASATIPNGANGTLPKYIRISATANAHVRIGAAGLTAVATDILVTPADSFIIKVCGATTIAAIQDAAAGVVNVIPLEDS